MNITVRRWFVNWFLIGFAIGVMAMANIFFREDITVFGIRMILGVGTLHWVIAGLVCWSYDGIVIDNTKMRETQDVVSRAKSRSAGA